MCLSLLAFSPWRSILSWSVTLSFLFVTWRLLISVIFTSWRPPSSLLHFSWRCLHCKAFPSLSVLVFRWSSLSLSLVSLPLLTVCFWLSAGGESASWTSFLIRVTVSFTVCQSSSLYSFIFPFFFTPPLPSVLQQNLRHSSLWDLSSWIVLRSSCSSIWLLIFCRIFCLVSECLGIFLPVDWR